MPLTVFNKLYGKHLNIYTNLVKYIQIEQIIYNYYLKYIILYKTCVNLENNPPTQKKNDSVE